MVATQLDLRQPLLTRLAGFIGPSNSDTSYLTHGLHPYPAKYIPQLPRSIIIDHTNERNTILDPFCGSGTTLLEACILGRKSIGVDSNPIATLISRAKTTPLSTDETEMAEGFLIALSVLDHSRLPDLELPPIPRLHHWFQQNVAQELAFIKSRIEEIGNERVKDFLQCVFSSIIVSVSNQESETRYAAKPKDLPDGHAMKRFIRKLADSIPQIKELSAIKTAHRNIPRVLTADARHLDEVIESNSIDLVVTSPPYPNSYDYYLYHKMRMFWLGHDHRVAQEKEIGSRHEHSSKKAEVDVFERKMIPVLKSVARVLRPSKLAYFFIGDAIIAGKYIQMAQVFRRIGEAAGLRFVADNEYSLESVTRSFHEKKWSSNKNQKAKMQRIVVFEGIVAKNQVYVGNREIAQASATRKPIALKGVILNRAELAIEADNSNRHIHSLGTYPSKFLPDIPRWGIKQFSSPGQTVLDPFAGAGTTSIEGIILSRNMLAADFSPYSCLLTKGKATRVSSTTLDKHALKLFDVLRSPGKLPARKRLEFELDTFWFNTDHLKQFERLRYFVDNEIPPSTRKFFLAVLSTTIKAFSYLDAGQVKVKRDPKKVMSGTPSPVDLMINRLPKYLQRLKAFNDIAGREVSHRVINCSADQLHSKGIAPKSIDLIVTSPPYINAMNYSMTHRYENLLLRLLPESALIPHQAGYFGTERVYAQDYSLLNQVSEARRFAGYLNPRLADIFEREPKRSYITYKYMTDMFRSFRVLTRLLKPSGYFVLVAGSNDIRNIHIDTFNILVTALEELGLTLESSFHYEIIKNAFKLRRHHTASRIKMDGVAVMRKA